MMTPQQLKNSILQRAIEGKLVEQRPEEGTAKELLKQIKAEKDRLVKEGKIKKTKPMPPITEDEIPFEIPDNWEWVRLGGILNKITDGTHHSPTNNIKGDFKYITAKNIKDTGIDETNITYVTNEVHQEIFNRCDPEFGDILLIKDGATTGTVTCNNFDEPFSMLSSVALLKPNKFIVAWYIVYVLRSDLLYSILRKQMKGTGITRITLNQIAPILIPLPPLAEQQRIVAKIEELMPLVEEYGKVYEDLTALNKKFPADMKKSILQYAIEGKLVEQRPEEGTAADLLKQIKAEKAKLIKEGKIKKEKPLPPITDDEIPFDIPESWVWCRLGDISNYAQPKVKIKPCDIQENIWSLDLEDIEKDTGRILNKVYSTDRKIKGEKVAFSKGNILYSKLRPYLRKILIATDDGITSPEIIPFNIYGEVHQSFFMWFLKTNYVDSVVNEASYGVKMPRVGTETMRNLLIALPPLAEQRRIVERIEQLLPLCDKLL